MAKRFDPAELTNFAREYGFHYDSIDGPGLVGDVISEMQMGLEGKPSSLAMIPAYIRPVSKITPLKSVIALDAGGTNLRAALIRFDKSGKAIIEDSRKTHMPGTRGPLSADAFFDEFAALTGPLITEAKDEIEGIGICFSYPMEINKDADGIALAFSKEVEANEVIGKAIGAGLRDALARQSIKAPGRIILLNDTAATLLAGQGASKETTTIGFILGTGFNTAYPESKIPKIGFNSPENPQIVVCESGNFAHKYMGILDKEFDSTTKSPGKYTLEKTVSGAYLGPLTLHILRQANKDGLLNFERAKEFFSMSHLDTKDLNDFLHDPYSQKGPVGSYFNKEERDAIDTLCFLSSIITERGAFLSAGVLAATVYRTGRKSIIAVEGSTFMLFKGMRRALESHLRLLSRPVTPTSYAYDYSIVPVEQASLLGAAVAALTA
ncbi:MAG: hexokinase [Treponema sp.]|nr:hexokinase [Treponema sp.]